MTIAIRALPQIEAASGLETSAERGSEEWKKWRHGPGWQEWNRAIAPVITARRPGPCPALGQQTGRCQDSLRRKSPTRIYGSARRGLPAPASCGLAKPRLGDAGIRAILEFVGVHDRKRRKAARPAFETETEAAVAESPATETTASETAAE